MRPKRKERLETYRLRDRAVTVFLLAVFFALGLWISLNAGPKAMLIYLLAWGLSYGVMYRSTCAGCVYYGRACPIPAEGECVHLFVRKREASFGRASLLWASLSYLLWISVPVFLLLRDRNVSLGVGYGVLFAAFWIVHLFSSGCPNCVHAACPLNPDYPFGNSPETPWKEKAP